MVFEEIFHADIIKIAIDAICKNYQERGEAFTELRRK